MNRITKAVTNFMNIHHNVGRTIESSTNDDMIVFVCDDEIIVCKVYPLVEEGGRLGTPPNPWFTDEGRQEFEDALVNTKSLPVGLPINLCTVQLLRINSDQALVRAEFMN